MLMRGYEKLYYEQPDLWGKNLSPEDAERIKNILKLIPGDVKSILDAGCGDGRIVNILADKYKTVGLDISEEALKHVKIEKVCGSVDDMPFASGSFDLVICCEVLEHLPYGVYQRTIEEIMKVTRKYIIVSVPNNENRKNGTIACPFCKCTFHQNRHIQSFNEIRMKSLFKGFFLRRLFTCNLEKVYPSFIIKTARQLNIFSNYPWFAICPQCGYSKNSGRSTISVQDKPKKFFKAIRSLIRILPLKKGGGHLIALYQKNNNLTN